MTKAIRTAMPLYLEGTNGKAVLVQHGYNGYPGEMYDLARRLNDEGYTVVVPRLPGHGTNSRDFRNSNWKLWLEHVRNEYINLHSRYDAVSVAGLSMGGVLALLLAAEFSPEKAILLAPAMAVAKKVFYLTPVMKYIIPEMKRDWKPGPEESEDRLVMAREYWSHYYTAPIASLNRLMRMAKRRLPEVDCPVFIMLSEKDLTVPLEAGDVIARGLRVPVEKLVLKNSPHVVFDGPEKDAAIEQVIRWIKK